MFGKLADIGTDPLTECTITKYLQAQSGGHQDHVFSTTQCATFVLEALVAKLNTFQSWQQLL